MDRDQQNETQYRRHTSRELPSSEELGDSESDLPKNQAHSSDSTGCVPEELAVKSSQFTRASTVHEDNIIAQNVGDHAVRHQFPPGRAHIDNDGLALTSRSSHLGLSQQSVSHERAVLMDLLSGDEGPSSRMPLWDTRENNPELVGEAMTSIDDILEDTQDLRASSMAEDDTSTVTVEELKEIMLGSGWCIHQVEHLAKIYELPVLCRLARLDKTVQRPDDHHSCLEKDGCIAYNSRPETYRTKHAVNCSDRSCPMIKVPYKDLVRIIESGGVPLISIHEHPDTGLGLSVHRRKFRGDYVTISHVWADGLGNPRENALPRCQIRLLQSLLDHNEDVGSSGGWVKWVDSMIFGGRHLRMLWMDTLCIPPNDTPMRAQCIDAMASIYAGSSTTFVLDKELMAIPTNAPLNEQHILEQIICSVWMCRAWTLQEAILPEHCLFQLNGNVFHPSPERLDYGTSGDGIPRNAISRTLFNDILLVRDRDRTSTESFVSTWNSLAGRSTTQTANLYVVLASCLDFKLRQFREFDSNEEKMQRIIFSFKELPISLFFNANPRLRSASNHYNRWVPTHVSRHLLTAGPSTFAFPGPNVSQYSDHGTRLGLKLGSELSIYVVNEVIYASKAFNIHTSDGWYIVQPIIEAGDTFETTAYTATCLFVAKCSLGASPMRSGACFYVLTSQAPGNLQHKQFVFEMAYFCPILFKALGAQTDQQDHDDKKSYSAHEVPCTRQFWVRFDPIPGFKALRRQSRRKQFSSFGKRTCFLILILNENLLIIVSSFVFWAFYEDRPNTAAGIVVFILVNMFIGMLILSLPWFAGTFIFVRLRDYMVLYESYDDNSVADKFSRLLASVGKATLDGLRGIIRLPLHALGVIQSGRREPTESVELE